MAYLLVFFSSFIATLFLTPYLIIYLRRSRIVDIPAGRKIHTEIVPRMGGLIIFFVVMGMMSTYSEDFLSLKYLLISLTILISCGILDDINGLSSYLKFAIQIVSGIFIYLYFQPEFTSIILFEYEIPPFLNEVVLIMFIVGVINSINLLDGLDGLASGFSLLIFSIILALSIISGNSFLIFVSVTLIGSLLGFLKYNAFPAKVFLGDSGSLLLGFFLVVTSIMTSLSYSNNVIDLTFPIMLLAVPIIDTIKVFFKRILMKKNPFTADNSHIHYEIHSRKVKHEITVFVIEIFSASFILLSLFYLKGYHLITEILFLFFALTLIFVKPTISLIRRIYILKENLIQYINLYPLKNTLMLKHSLVFLSTLLIMIIILFEFPIETNLSLNNLLFIIIACTTLLILSFFQQYKSKVISHLNVFFNFTIFFALSRLSLPAGTAMNISVINSADINLIAFLTLSLILTIFIMVRGRILMGNRIFFSGIDLTMIVLILLSFGVNKVLQFDYSYFLSMCLLEAFIFYIWYKVMVNVKLKNAVLLSYFSFILPMVSILFLII